jgi:predicted nucleic acid-binding Zn ribbon protein
LPTGAYPPEPASVTPPTKDATDPVQVFTAWATQVRAHRQSLPTCSQCHCPTPPGELARWGLCSLCAAKQWQGPL